jgi:general nucleoside transport system permease protein
MDPAIIIPLLAAAVQSGTPILYATLGEIFTEKSGVLNLGVEGMHDHRRPFRLYRRPRYRQSRFCLYSCRTGGNACFVGSWRGLPLVQGQSGGLGLALTILGSGLANYLGTSYVGQIAPAFKPLAVPLLSKIPVLGPIFFNHDPLVYLTYGIPPLMWLFLTRTRHGLSMRAAGEYPAAATAAGLNVTAYRWLGILTGGFFMGLGGAYLSLAYTHLWTNNLTGGRGWIAVALVIFAFWRPGRAVFGAYLFGGIMALQLRLQASGTQLPSSLLLMLPYALTVFVLVLSSWRQGVNDAPAALGSQCGAG